MPKPSKRKTAELPIATTWAAHKSKWKDCKDCKLCDKRRRVVLGRGVLPCDVLFVGEAPGTSEDALGKPFVGPAGKLLDELIDAALANLGMDSPRDRPRMAWTNMVACIPKYKPGEVGQPKRLEIEACSGRLNELVQLAKPQAIVMVGKLASQWAPKFIDYDFEYSIDLTHPASVLRESPARKGLSIDRIEIQLTELFEDIFVPF